MFENPRRGRQARNVTTNAPKIRDLKSSSEQIFSRKWPLGAPEVCSGHTRISVIPRLSCSQFHKASGLLSLLVRLDRTISNR